jgi:hypothetical protein
MTTARVKTHHPAATLCRMANAHCRHVPRASTVCADDERLHVHVDVRGGPHVRGVFVSLDVTPG